MPKLTLKFARTQLFAAKAPSSHEEMFKNNFTEAKTNVHSK